MKNFTNNITTLLIVSAAILFTSCEKEEFISNEYNTLDISLEINAENEVEQSEYYEPVSLPYCDDSEARRLPASEASEARRLPASDANLARRIYIELKNK